MDSESWFIEVLDYIKHGKLKVLKKKNDEGYIEDYYIDNKKDIFYTKTNDKYINNDNIYSIIIFIYHY